MSTSLLTSTVPVVTLWWMQMAMCSWTFSTKLQLYPSVSFLLVVFRFNFLYDAQILSLEFNKVDSNIVYSMSVNDSISLAS